MTLPSPPVFVATVPFGEDDDSPLALLRRHGIAWRGNPLGRKLRPGEVAEAVGDAVAVIAGTETYDDATLAACPNLKVVCRVGVGLDGVDLAAAARRGIAVAYTPEAPAPAVAELTVGLALDLLRGVARADRGLRAGLWRRSFGGRLACATVGVVGAGRIGGRVIRHLLGGFPGVRILARDPRRDPSFDDNPAVTWADMDRLLAESDIITLHVPLTPETRGMIDARALAAMKPGALLINTARGGVADEAALAAALAAGALAGAAVDVFEQEPYSGPLATLENILLTCHMGSMTRDCRARMELEATEEAVRFLKGQPLLSPVPDGERLAQAAGEKKETGAWETGA